jgi:hypothetical protein
MADDLGIPKSLMVALVHIFFENAYNATLLLHRRSFVDSLEKETANPHIVLSTCAWAAKYGEKAVLMVLILTLALSVSIETPILRLPSKIMAS